MPPLHPRCRRRPPPPSTPLRRRFPANDVMRTFLLVVGPLQLSSYPVVAVSKLLFMLRRFPIESKGRRKKLHEVGSVTTIYFTCFLIRCVVVSALAKLFLPPKRVLAQYPIQYVSQWPLTVSSNDQIYQRD